MPNSVKPNVIRVPLALRAGIVILSGVFAFALVSLVAVTALSKSSSSFTAGETVVDLGVPLSTIPTGHAVVLVAPAGTAFEMIDGGGSNRLGEGTSSGWFVHSQTGLLALAANSSHLGCSVLLNLAARTFEDPCGGSLFSLDGSVLHGPAMYPLSHLSWREYGASSILVKTIPPRHR